MPISKGDAEALLAELAEAKHLNIFTDVPATGPEAGGWAADEHQRTVHVALAGTGHTGVQPFNRDKLTRALSNCDAVHPVSATNSLDRTLLGFHATREAYLSRTWNIAGPSTPIAAVARAGSRSNVTDAFEAAGIDIWPEPPPTDGSFSLSTGGGGGRDPWSNRETGDREDKLLFDLRQGRPEPAWWLAEVPIGWSRTPTESKARRIDAVVIPWTEPRCSAQSQDLDAFADAAPQAPSIELIEAKRQLNADAIGQLLAAAHMFPASWSTSAPLKLTACVKELGDAAVQWFCREGIPDRWNVDSITVVQPKPAAGS